MENLLQLANERALHLTENPTRAEVLMIAKLKYSGIRYKFQYVVTNSTFFYIVDFFIPKLSLVVEIDGPYHDSEEMKQNDHKRDVYLQSKGYKIIHIKNEDVDTFKTLSLIDYKPIPKRISKGKLTTAMDRDAKKAKAFFDRIERTKYGKK